MITRIFHVLCICVALAIAATARAGNDYIVDLTDGNADQSVSLDVAAMRVYAVDDNPIKERGILIRLFTPNLGEYVRELRLASGKHRVLMHATGKIGCGWVYLWFVAEPGKRYVAKVEFDRLRYRAWIEESETQMLVGGNVGSSDEPEPKAFSAEMYKATRARCI